MPIKGAAEARRVLGVSEDATAEDVRSAYRAKALATHPDRTGTGDKEEFIRATEAYRTLQGGLMSEPSLEQLMNSMLRNDPRSILAFLESILSRAENKPIDDLPSLISRQQYKEARAYHERNPYESREQREEVKRALITNLRRQSIHEPNIEQWLEETRYYSSRLGLDHEELLAEVQETVLERLEKNVMRRFRGYYTAEEMEGLLEESFEQLDELPLPTQSIEDKLAQELAHRAHERIRKGTGIKQALDQLSILDDYFSPEENPRRLVQESYRDYTAPHRGRAIPRTKRGMIAEALTAYATHGIEEAKQARRHVLTSGRL